MGSTTQPKDGIEGRTHDIFFSYASEDRAPVARPLVRALRRVGLSVWYDEIDNPWKDGYAPSKEEITEGLQSAMGNCRESWLLIGPDYKKKQGTSFEARTLASRDKSAQGRVGIIHHRLSVEDARDVAASFGLFVERSGCVEYKRDPMLIAKQLVKPYASRVSMMGLRRFKGPLDIAIFDDLGQVVIFSNGGFGASNGEISGFDYCGHELSKAGGNMHRVFSVYMDESGTSPGGVQMDDQKPLGAARLGSVTETGEVSIVFLNHPERKIDTPEQVENGVVRNIGGLIFIPAVTHGPVTVGMLKDTTPPIVQECLRISEHMHKGNWRAVYFSKDQASFSVEAAED